MTNIARPILQNEGITTNIGQLRRDMATRRIGGFLLKAIPILAFIFLWFPIIVLVVFSFNESRLNAVWQGFTLQWYQNVFSGVAGAEARFSSAQLLLSLRNSIFVAIVSMIISTILGTMLALGMHRFNFRLKKVVDAMLYIPLVIPEITMAVALLVFYYLTFDVVKTIFPGSNPTLGFGTIIIGHVVFNISYVTIIVRARLSGMPKNLDEAAADLGANEWNTFRFITLPLIMPGVISGALLAITLSLDDFIITFFTQGVGTTTLPIFVYGMIKFAVTPEINVISTLILIASTTLVVASLGLQRRR